jgi:hypothetical protein
MGKFSVLLTQPPLARACEPPAGIARLAGALRRHNLPPTLLDVNLGLKQPLRTC